MIVSLIVAMAENRVIGRGGKLPWHLPADLKHFKKITLHHPVIMGRKTFESIGRLLPERENIIVSRKADYVVPGAKVVSSVEQALAYCEGKSDEVFVLGGAEIYLASFPYVKRIYLTKILKEFEGDTFFPDVDLSDFKEISCEAHLDELPFSFVVLER